MKDLCHSWRPGHMQEDQLMSSKYQKLGPKAKVLARPSSFRGTLVMSRCLDGGAWHLNPVCDLMAPCRDEAWLASCMHLLSSSGTLPDFYAQCVKASCACGMSAYWDICTLLHRRLHFSTSNGHLADLPSNVTSM